MAPYTTVCPSSMGQYWWHFNWNNTTILDNDPMKPSSGKWRYYHVGINLQMWIRKKSFFENAKLSRPTLRERCKEQQRRIFLQKQGTKLSFLQETKICVSFFFFHLCWCWNTSWLTDMKEVVSWIFENILWISNKDNKIFTYSWLDDLQKVRNIIIIFVLSCGAVY